MLFTAVLVAVRVSKYAWNCAIHYHKIILLPIVSLPTTPLQTRVENSSHRERDWKAGKRWKTPSIKGKQGVQVICKFSWLCWMDHFSFPKLFRQACDPQESTHVFQQWDLPPLASPQPHTHHNQGKLIHILLTAKAKHLNVVQNHKWSGRQISRNIAEHARLQASAFGDHLSVGACLQGFKCLLPFWPAFDVELMHAWL